MRKILFGITGSISAYKTPMIVRLLKEKGFDVTCVMTKSAEKFVSPLVLSTFTENKVASALFSEDAHQMPHIQLAKSCDLMLIAPVSATIMARCAQGLAEDLVSLSYLTTTAPVIMAPSMHDTMWLHPATQANYLLLKKRNVEFLGPVTGKLADDTQGIGRMVEPEEIAAKVNERLAQASKLKKSDNQDVEPIRNS